MCSGLLGIYQNPGKGNRNRTAPKKELKYVSVLN
jgi:hypothetical protein